MRLIRAKKVENMTEKTTTKKEYKTNYNEKSKLNLQMQPFNEKPNFKELSSKGGKASVKRKKELKHAKEILNDILSQDISQDRINDILGKDADLINDKSAYTVMMAKMLQVANSGNVKASEFIRDTVGDKPTEEVNISANVITDNDRQLLNILSENMAKMGLNPDK